MKTRLNLTWKDDLPYIVNEEYLKPYIYDLLEFLDGLDYMNNLDFAKKVMMSQELKANNIIEGITDDLSLIDEVIDSLDENIPEERRKRIINLYHGYQYILTHQEISKDSLRELYSYLSEELLDDYGKENTGEYYRTKPVYIRKRSRLDAYTEGIEASKIDYHMNMLLDYLNEQEPNNEMEAFIKSQIAHFYFVYIHPYLDVNGRTSRTLAMWYLLNNNSYPYIVFNRAISFAQRDYETYISNSINKGEVTLFLRYMLTQVQTELEKEHIIYGIENNAGLILTKEEHQMMEYLLSMKSTMTAKELAAFYNRFNQKIPISSIVENKIEPLIEKQVLVRKNDTTKKLSNRSANFWLGINPELIEETPKIKTLSIKKFI